VYLENVNICVEAKNFSVQIFEDANKTVKN
jgi:hypothetical protein